MNHQVIRAACQARRRKELYFLGEKLEKMKEEEERRNQELEADAAMAELCGYDPEPVFSNR